MYRRAVAGLAVLVLLFAAGLGVWGLLRPYADLQRLYGRGFAVLSVVAGVALLLTLAIPSTRSGGRASSGH